MSGLDQLDQIGAIFSDIIYAAPKGSGVSGDYSQDRILNAKNEHSNRARASGRSDIADELDRYEVHCSNQDMAALVDRNTKKVFLLYRGTLCSTSTIVRDVVNDIVIATNGAGFMRTLTGSEFAHRVMQELGTEYQYIATGHSKGGSIAEFVAVHLNIKGILFNPGGSFINANHHQSLLNSIDGKKVDIVAHVIRPSWNPLSWDPVSISRWNVGHTKYHDHVKGWGHSLNNFLQYDKRTPSTNASLGGIDLSNASTQLLSTDPLPFKDFFGAVLISDSIIPMLFGSVTQEKDSLVNVEDFAVALALAHYKVNAQFSLDPLIPTNPNGPWLQCVYYPDASSQLPFDIAKTKFGRTLFEADFILKQLAMGVNCEDMSLSHIPSLPLPIRIFPRPLKAIGMGSEFDYQRSIGKQGQKRYSRLWITVDSCNYITGSTHRAPDTSINTATNVGLQFAEVKMKVNLMRQSQDLEGKLIDVLDPAILEPEATDVQFAKFMTEHFDAVAQHYAPLRRLQQLTKLVAVAKWLLDQNINFDLDMVLSSLKTTQEVIETVPALTRTERTHDYGLTIFGGIDLRFTFEQNQSFNCEPMIKVINQICDGKNTSSTKNANGIVFLKSDMCAIPIPFLQQRCCNICALPISYRSPFPPPMHSDIPDYCEDHHPDACYFCGLPIFIDPNTMKRFTDAYQFSTLPDNSNLVHHGIEKQIIRFHPSCFECASCKQPFSNNEGIKADVLAANTYYHMNCSSPMHSFFKDRNFRQAYLDAQIQQMSMLCLQVTVCPLCNKLVPVSYGESPDVKVGEHIDRGCQSDPIKAKATTDKHSCLLKGCKQVEFIAMICPSCRNNFCLKHKSPLEHNCCDYDNSVHSMPLPGAAAARRQIYNSVLNNMKSNDTFDTLHSVRNEAISLSNGVPISMSDDEALALALHMSLNDVKESNDKIEISQEQSDRMLAEALACSEEEFVFEEERR